MNNNLPRSTAQMFGESGSFDRRMIMVSTLEDLGDIIVPANVISFNNSSAYETMTSSFNDSTHLHENDEKTVKKIRINSVEEISEAEHSDNYVSTPKRKKIEKNFIEDPEDPFILSSPNKEPASPGSETSDSSSEERKPIENNSYDDIDHTRDLDEWVGHVKPVPGIPRQSGNKQDEIIKAARSLFSKRTRTLYHWLYPCTPKTKLKATVTAAWDTLSNEEKEFYISQVLGRFGVPAGNLMVNPQLGGFKSASLSASIDDSFSSTTQSQSEESQCAVSNLLLSEDEASVSAYSIQEESGTESSRKRKKHGNVKSSKIRAESNDEEETDIFKQIFQASLEEDFADDPELGREFKQFSWALHVNNTPDKF